MWAFTMLLMQVQVNAANLFGTLGEETLNLHLSWHWELQFCLRARAVEAKVGICDAGMQAAVSMDWTAALTNANTCCGHSSGPQYPILKTCPS